MLRLPAVADQFYPADPQELKNLINKFLKEAKPPKLNGRLRALIMPHAGYVYSGSVAAYGYKVLKEIGDSIQKIILIGPSHHFTVKEPVYSSAKSWVTPLGEVNVLTPSENINNNDQAHHHEHSLEVQIPFLQSVIKDFSILPLLINDQEQSAGLAQKIEKIIDDQTFIIVSSDLSHFYSQEVAEGIDSSANKYIPALDLNKIKNEVDACGLAAVLTLVYLAKKLGWHGQLLKYQTSGDVTGDLSQVVGYGAYAFFV